MLKKLKFTLIGGAMAYLGLCGSGFANEMNTDTSIDKNEYGIWNSQATRLSKKEIAEGLVAGGIAGATHMLIVMDSWDYEGSYEFIVYRYPGEDLNEIIKYHTAPGYFKVSAVYTIH